MQQERLYQPFEIDHIKMDACPKGGHKHSFFELIYVVGGAGVQCINDNRINYQPGQLFLITPEDSHSFIFEKTTELAFVRFNDIYVRSQRQHDPRDLEWTKKLEYILHNASHQPGCILRNAPDRMLVKAMIESMLGEFQHKQLYYNEVISHIVNTLITVVARNLGMTTANKVTDNTANTVVSILNYIQENIYDTDKLKAEVIAGHFGIADGYLSRYFKKHTGDSIQQYIINYKLKLVETRLLYSDMRINEIVYELGFTDESHLNRLFKKYKGLTPTAFRKQQLAVTGQVAG